MSSVGAAFAEGETTHGAESTRGDGPVKSLAKLAEQKLLDDLASSLTSQARSATFACGGSVPFITDTQSTTAGSLTLESNDTEENTIPPVQLRLGSNGEGIILTFPGAKDSLLEKQELLAACQPASFGRGSEEVLDEDYRKAGKLDREAFATNFCPYEAGIIDIVTQLLLPQTNQEKHMRSINAPSGKFKAHVDTPRRKSQIGSLIVGLPLEHSGGNLAVRHLGKEILFDWSSKALDVDDSRATTAHSSIQWAAFYSDCEHEVHEVTSGHRLTLTYNLYVCRGQGHLAGHAPSLNAKYLPFYCTLTAALENPSFVRKGKIFGIYLNHNYAHTSKDSNFLLASLKGADLSIYETARVLDLDCKLVLIIDTGYGDRMIFFNKFYKLNCSGNECVGDDEIEYFAGRADNLPRGHPLSESKITWLNKAFSMKEPQDAFLTCGNETGMAVHYSRAAMFIRIPKYNRYGAKAEQPLQDALVSRSGWYEEDSFDEDEEFESD